MAAYAKLEAEKQNKTNFLHTILSFQKTRQWEVRHDITSSNAQLLTFRWHVTIAGISGNEMLLDTSARDNFLSTRLVENDGLRYTQLSFAGSISLGIGAYADQLGKVISSLSIRHYHTNTLCMSKN